ncbi:hypothetical protein ABPG74_022486 [Tetrahymena malaccensis]
MPSDGKMQHLKAIYFIRPTEENLKLLQKEIEKPRFAEYYIFYSNSVPNLTIESLAQIDTNDFIKEIHEVYADYYCLSRDLFSINILNTFGLTKEQTSWSQLDNQILQRTYEGLLSLLLSLKRIPMIKYLSSSEPCFHIASKLTKKLRDERDNNKSQLGADTKTLLLIWDRREDPITPLLNQWTYQAMLHELIGINNNRVDIERKMRAFNEASNSSKEDQMEKEFVVSDHDDQFYCDNMYENFGALAENIRNLIESVIFFYDFYILFKLSRKNRFASNLKKGSIIINLLKKFWPQQIFDSVKMEQKSTIEDQMIIQILGELNIYLFLIWIYLKYLYDKQLNSIKLNNKEIRKWIHLQIYRMLQTICPNQKKNPLIQISMSHQVVRLLNQLRNKELWQFHRLNKKYHLKKLETTKLRQLKCISRS